MAATIASCTSSCRRAVGFHCECHCGGSQHGAARIEWAKALAAVSIGTSGGSTTDTVRTWRTAREEATRALTNRIGARRRRQAKRSDAARARTPHLPLTDTEIHVAEEFARTEILVLWLSADGDSLAQLEALAEEISSQGAAAIDELVAAAPDDGRRRKRIQDRLGDHFWCDLLAALVVVLEVPADLESRIRDDIAQATGHVAALVWAEIKRSREQSHGYTPGAQTPRPLRSTADERARLDDVILRSAVTAVVTRVLDALFTSLAVSPEEVRTRLQVLALIMCPDPAAHQLVWEHCWRPLFRSVLKQELLDELNQHLEDGEGLSRPHLWDGADSGPPHGA